MPGQPLVLGPFPGGINNRTDPGSIEQIELNECTNFIYGVDGTLIGRWPITPLYDLTQDIFVQDNFNRADGDVGDAVIGGTWVQANTPLIVSNQLQLGPTDEIKIDTGESDIEFEVTLVDRGFIAYGVISPRFVNTANCILVSAFEVAYIISNVQTTLATYTTPIASGSVIKVICNGSSIKVYDDGVEIASVTTSQYLTETTQCLWQHTNYNSIWDNLTIQSLDAVDISGISTWTESMHLLGATVLYDTEAGTVPGVAHSIVVGSNNPDGTWVYEAGVWHKISNNEYKAFVTYGEQDNRIYFPGNPDEPTQDGGSWGYNDGYGASAVVEDPDTPVGDTMTVHKERLWISGNPFFPSRLYFTRTFPQGEATGDWDEVETDDNPQPADYVDVEPGNGQKNIYIKAFADAITIFKDDSTYVLGYDGDFAQGQLVQVNGDIGTDNNESVVEYQNILVVYHEGKMYAYANSNFQALNDKFRFLSDDAYVAIWTHPVSLSAIGDFILLRHYDKIFVYSFITGGWGEWTTEFPVGNFVQLPMFAGDETKTYFISSIDATEINVFRMYQTWNSTDTEDFVCFARTKVYSFDAPYVYKRLFWWGIEALTNLPLTGSAQPVSESYTPDWSEVLAYTWGDILLNTWGSMFSGIPDVVTGPIDAQQGNVYRRMYKFLKGLRFREISFRVDMVSDGSSTNGPPRLLSVVPVLKAAETVVKQVS